MDVDTVTPHLSCSSNHNSSKYKSGVLLSVMKTFIITLPRVTTCNLYAYRLHPLCLIPYALSFYPMLISLSSLLTSYAYSFRTRNSTRSMLTDPLLIYDLIRSSAALLRTMLLLRHWLVTYLFAISSFHILSSNRMIRSPLT